MDHAALKIEIESGPLAAELAPYVRDRNDLSILKIANSRDTGLTMPRPVVPVAAGLLSLIDPAKLSTIFNSGLAVPLSTALKAGDSAELVVLATAFVAAGWISPEEYGAVASYLSSEVETPCSMVEKAGLVEFGGAATLDQISDALNAKDGE